MKNSRSFPPILPLVLAWAAFAVYVWATSGQLPEHVATHFGANGQPNGWETQAGYVRFRLIFGAAVPALVLGTFLIIRYFNGWGLNIPHKAYWLAPERQGQTMAFVQRQGAWFAGLLIAFFAGLHYTILAANTHSPVSLPSTFFLWVVGPFLGATILWGVIFIGHFFRKPV